MRWITGIIIVAVVIIVITQLAASRDKEREAVKIAQEYLNQKYEQEMIYQDIRKAPIEPGVYHVMFSSAKTPEIEFEVTVPNSLMLPERVLDFGRSDHSADNYYYKHFEYQMKKYLVEDVTRLWEDNATIRVTVMDISGFFTIPPELNDTMSIKEMDSIVSDYWVAITINNMPFDSKSVEVEASKIFEFIQNIQNDGFSPEGISCRFISGKNSIDVVISNWRQMDTVAQVLEQLETGFEKVNK